MPHRKYAMTEEAIEWKGFTLHRIRALKSFGMIEIGDVGGWIEHENNLSHADLCWIYDDAKVFGQGRVFDNAQIVGHAQIYGCARVFGDAWILDHAVVCDRARVCDDAWISDHARICGCAIAMDDAWISDHAVIDGSIRIVGDTRKKI